MNLDNPAVVHHVLHGYNDGHRLLSSSVRLPKEVERIMLPLSDLSGQSGGTVEPYLTGYPLKATSQYAFARTWLAPEIRRPGCVWTHTFIVNFDDLQSFLSRDDLIDLFRRPKNETDLSYYREPIELDKSKANKEFLFTQGFANRILYLLISKDEGQVAVSVPSFSVVERDFVEVWRRLWPPQQKYFTFCTGVKVPRTLDGQCFDLQAVHEKELIRFKRRAEIFNLSYIEFELVPGNTAQIADWLEAFNASRNSSLGVLAQRILPSNFQNTKVIVDLLTQRATETSFAPKVIAYLASKFPTCASGKEVKEFLLGERDPLQLSQFAILSGLTTSDDQAAFDPLQLDIARRASSLWESADKAIQLSNVALDNQKSVFATNVLRGLTETVPPESLPQIILSRSDALDFYMNANPSIATNSAIWQVPPEFLGRVVNGIVRHHTKLREHLRTIVENALAIGLNQGWESLLENFGFVVTEDVLDACEKDGYSCLPESCETTILKTPETICDWIGRRTILSAGITNIVLSLAMRAADANQAESSNKLLELIVQKHRKFASDLHGNVKLLALALAGRQESLQPLAELSLDSVYSAIADSQISESDWAILAQFVPKIEWWRGWDRCARMRKAIADKFLSSHWPLETLFTITSNDALFEGLLEEFGKQSHGDMLLKRAAAFPTTTFRKKCLTKAVDEFID